jgi:hypothetical protein
MAKLDKFFVSTEIHERTVKLPDGSEHLLHFRELPAADFRRFHMAEMSEDEDVRAGSMAKLICACLCEPDGKAAITYKQALQLKPAAANALIGAVLSVNGMKDDAGKS